jgi:hypothetical protein
MNKQIKNTCVLLDSWPKGKPPCPLCKTDRDDVCVSVPIIPGPISEANADTAYESHFIHVGCCYVIGTLVEQLDNLRNSDLKDGL